MNNLPEVTMPIEDEAARLEEQLLADPRNAEIRGKIVMFYSLTARKERDEDVKRDAARKAAEHYLWLVEHQPDVELLENLTSLVGRDEKAVTKAKELWLEHAKRDNVTAQTLVNAASFLQLQPKDRLLSEQLLLRSVALDPNNAAARLRLAQFYITGPPPQPEKSLEHAEAALQLNRVPEYKEMLIEICAVASLEAGNLTKAAHYANELLEVLRSESGGMKWNRGNILHKGNIVLGRVALRNGDIAAAKHHLLEAGKTEGSPQLGSFGPNMALARELIAHDERAVVLDYLNLCEQFWKLGGEKLSEWKSNVEDGVDPDFGPNLIY
ncbi:MAG: hypothetical protein K1Y02_01930 [Candidatus Hydrogenedentes bacterium]|nr:hypothetical protein [Candidatus Hydrogenedentota bacterium]